MSENNQINPAKWDRPYQIALASTILIGALAGIAFGFTIFALHSAPDTVAGTLFTFWLKLPLRAGWWPWPLFGAAIFGLWFYAKRIIKDTP